MNSQNLVVKYPKFSLDDVDTFDYADLREDLETYGYAGVILRETVYDSEPHEILNWVTNLKADWPGKELVTIHGIIKNYGIGQSPLMWSARRKLFHFWTRLLQNDDLICSFDGANYQVGNASSNQNCWLHRDQRPQNSNFETYQSVIECNPNNSMEAGGLIVVPKSHKKIFTLETTSSDCRTTNHMQVLGPQYAMDMGF